MSKFRKEGKKAEKEKLPGLVVGKSLKARKSGETDKTIHPSSIICFVDIGVHFYHLL